MRRDHALTILLATLALLTLVLLFGLLSGSLDTAPGVAR